MMRTVSLLFACGLAQGEAKYDPRALIGTGRMQKEPKKVERQASTLGTWNRLYVCTGSHAYPANANGVTVEPYSKDQMIAMANAGTRIKICTLNDPDDCVVSVPNNNVITNLRNWRPLNNGNSGTNQWVDESTSYNRASNVNNMRPCTSSMNNDGSYQTQWWFWACGKGGGMHIGGGGTSKGRWCGWGSNNMGEMEILVDAEPPFPFPEAAQWGDSNTWTAPPTTAAPTEVHDIQLTVPYSENANKPYDAPYTDGWGPASQTLENGDVVWASTVPEKYINTPLSRDLAQAFDGVKNSDWNHAWHGACTSWPGVPSDANNPLAMEYTFSAGAKTVSAAKIWQVPGNGHQAGIIKIFWREDIDQDWTPVGNPTAAGFTSTNYLEELTISFDSTFTTGIRMEFYSHPNAGNPICVGASEIEFYGPTSTAPPTSAAPTTARPTRNPTTPAPTTDAPTTSFPTNGPATGHPVTGACGAGSTTGTYTTTLGGSSKTLYCDVKYDGAWTLVHVSKAYSNTEYNKYPWEGENLAGLAQNTNDWASLSEADMKELWDRVGGNKVGGSVMRIESWSPGGGYTGSLHVGGRTSRLQYIQRRTASSTFSPFKAIRYIPEWGSAGSNYAIADMSYASNNYNAGTHTVTHDGGAMKHWENRHQTITSPNGNTQSFTMSRHGVPGDHKGGCEWIYDFGEPSSSHGCSPSQNMAYCNGHCHVGNADIITKIWIGGSDASESTTAPPTAVEVPRTFPPTTDAPVKDLGYTMQGDPILSYNGKKSQIYLPVGQMSPLLDCQNTKLFGRVMTSGIDGDTQQWFDQFHVKNGAQVLTVGVRNIGQDQLRSAQSTEGVDMNVNATDLSQKQRVQSQLGRIRAAAERTKVHHQALSTIFVKIETQTTDDDDEPGAEVVISAPGKVPKVGDTELETTVIQDLSKEIGQGYVETVDFDAPHLSMQITTSVAHKMNNANERMGYLHLDTIFNRLDTSVCAGPLAEVWGLRPMSKNTAKLLVPPNEQVQK